MPCCEERCLSRTPNSSAASRHAAGHDRHDDEEERTPQTKGRNGGRSIKRRKASRGYRHGTHTQTPPASRSLQPHSFYVRFESQNTTRGPHGAASNTLSNRDGGRGRTKDEEVEESGGDAKRNQMQTPMRRPSTSAALRRCQRAPTLLSFTLPRPHRLRPLRSPLHLAFIFISPFFYDAHSLSFSLP